MFAWITSCGSRERSNAPANRAGSWLTTPTCTPRATTLKHKLLHSSRKTRRFDSRAQRSHLAVMFVITCCTGTNAPGKGQTVHATCMLTQQPCMRTQQASQIERHAHVMHPPIERSAPCVCAMEKCAPGSGASACPAAPGASRPAGSRRASAHTAAAGATPGWTCRCHSGPPATDHPDTVMSCRLGRLCLQILCLECNA